MIEKDGKERRRQLECLWRRRKGRDKVFEKNKRGKERRFGAKFKAKERAPGDFLTGECPWGESGCGSVLPLMGQSHKGVLMGTVLETR